jgi:capsular exopolysaccharide synthesis family protein
LEKLERPEFRKSLLKCFSIRPAKKAGDSIFSPEERGALENAIRGSLSTERIGEGLSVIGISARGYEPQMVAQVADAASQKYIEMYYEFHLESFQKSFSVISKSLAQIREKIKTGEMALEKVNAEIQLYEALKVYGEKYPMLLKLREEIPALTEKLKKGIQNLATSEVGQRHDQLSLLLTPHLHMPDLEVIEADLYILKPIIEQEIQTNKEMYNSMFKKLEENELSGSGKSWLDVKVIDSAAVPDRPIRPNKKLNFLIAILVGLFVGLGLVFLLEYLDSSFRTLEDVQHHLKLFPLGVIPQIETADLGQGERQTLDPLNLELSSETLLSDSKTALHIADAYRIVRTNLALGSPFGSAMKVFQVTSAVQHEGKTTTVANLGVSFAQAGMKTLLVDADMRRPSLHRLLDLETVQEGLSDALNNGKPWQSLVVPTATPHLFFLGAGEINSNSAESLFSEKMKGLLSEFKNQYDVILLDSPPVISIPDTAIIASCVDGTIMVSRSGLIPRHLSVRAKHTLEAVKARIVGCVLNHVRVIDQPYYYNKAYLKYYGMEPASEQTMNGKIQKMRESLGILKEKLKPLLETFFVYLLEKWRHWKNRFPGRKPSREQLKSPHPTV